MSYGKSGKKGYRNFKQNKKEIEDVNNDNPIIINFKKYSKELDDKHDRYERIVKLSRDVTIESKRIIFLLHTIDAKKGNTESVLEEAEKRLQTLCDNNFQAIAKEIGHLDPYQYGRAYSPGLQEFIEAHSFYEYLNKNRISDWDNIQKKLMYELQMEQIENDKKSTKNETDNELTSVNEDTKIDKNMMEVQKMSCFIQPIEFICGLADVGGEMMRRCINSLGCGDIHTCFESCRSLQELYAGYLGINNARSRELYRKIYTLRQSVLKVEHVCYNVKVRGGEAAKWGLITTDVVCPDKQFDQEDEGFF